MTEDEAKTKWCPFSAVVSGYVDSVGRVNPHGLGHTHNRIRTGNPEVPVTSPEMNCLGSGCMMWAAEKKYTPKFNERGEDIGGAYGDTGNGYCGFQDARGPGAIP